MPKHLASQTSVILKELEMKLDRVSMNTAPRELQNYNSRKISRLRLDLTTDTGFSVCGYSVMSRDTNSRTWVYFTAAFSCLHVTYWNTNDVPILYTEHFEERISRKKYTKKANIFSQLTNCFSITRFKILKYYTNKGTEHLSTLCQTCEVYEC
jgi:hypothetical protein